MATVQEIHDAAMAKSTKNQPGVIISETEAANQVQRIVQGAFSIAAVVQPTRFSDTADVVGVASAWARPPAAEAIIRIVNASGAEIVVVPYDDQLAEEPKTALYEFGQSFIANTGQTTPPGATDTLTFWFAKRPDALTAIDFTGVIDPDFPDAYLELLNYQLALYLALKDNRTEEYALLTSERDAWAQRFVSWLERGTPILRKRVAARRHYNMDTLISMLGVTP